MYPIMSEPTYPDKIFDAASWNDRRKVHGTDGLFRGHEKPNDSMTLGRSSAPRYPVTIRAVDASASSAGGGVNVAESGCIAVGGGTGRDIAGLAQSRKSWRRAAWMETA